MGNAVCASFSGGNMIEIVLEDKIAALQKTQKKLNNLKKHSQKEEKEVESSVKYSFKEQVCLNNQVKIPIIENFFEDNVEIKNFVMWKKQRNLVLSLELGEELKSIPELNDVALEIGESFKESKLYIEFTKVKEIKNNDYLYQYINIEIPTSIGTLIQDTLIVYHNNKSLTVVMFYSKDLVHQLNEALEYMMQHLIWEGETICAK